MKSKFLNSLFLLVWIFSFSYVNANEAFTFNVNDSSAFEALKEKIIQIKKNKELKNLFFIYI